MRQVDVASRAPWEVMPLAALACPALAGGRGHETAWCYGSPGLKATPLPPCRSPSGSRLCLLQSIMALAHLQAAVLCVQAATALHHQQSED